MPEPSSKFTTGVDQNYLYGFWKKSAQWRDSLHRRMSHKALDIPDEDMIEANRINVGIGWKEMAVVGALGLGAWWLLSDKPDATPPAAVDTDTDTQYGFDIGGDPALNPPATGESK